MRNLLAFAVMMSAICGFAENRVGEYYCDNGDLLVENLGCFTQTEPFLAWLTESPDEESAVLCSVIYEDRINPLPSTKEEMVECNRTSRIVQNILWLFLKELFAGAEDRFELLDEYRSQKVAEAIIERFAEYADREMRIWNKDNPDEAIDVEIKAVSMRANRMMLEEMEK